MIMSDCCQFPKFTLFTGAAGNKLPDKPGCYIITAPKLTQPIGRLLGADKSRTLYIGQSTKSIRARVGEFCKGANRPNGNRKHVQHPAGNRFLFIRSKLANLDVRPENILIYYKEYSNPNKLENCLLMCYTSKFGEVPPLNGGLNVGPGGNVLNADDINCTWPPPPLEQFAG